MLIRILRVLTILALASACWAVWATEPRFGAIAGTVTDKDGHPIAHAHVYLSRTSSDEGSGNSGSAQGDDNDDTVTDALGGTHAPYGWQEGGRNDAEATRGRRERSDDLEARADAGGHYRVDSVPAGVYSVSFSARGYQDEFDQGVDVAAEKTTTLHETLPPAPSSLSLDNTTPCWLPGEQIVVGLNGELANPNVTITIDRFDVSDVVAHNPAKLLATNGYDPSPPNVNWTPITTPVRTWPLTLKYSEDTGSFYERLKVGALPAGLYQITVHSPEASAYGWVNVTNLALIRKTYNKNVLAYVTDLATGAPVTDVPVNLTGPDRSALASAATNKDGLANLTYVAAPAESRGILIARRGNSTAAVSMELNSPGESGARAEEASDGDDNPNPAAYSAGALRSFIYTERPVYRPGQTVYFKGIARWFRKPHPAATPSSDYFTVAANEDVHVDIKDAQENLISHQDLKTNDMGSWNGSLALTTEALTGEYTIHAVIGGQTSETTFDAATYRKPEFQVKVTFDKKRYVRGDTINATVAATYYFGAPVSGGKLRYSVRSNDAGDEEGARDVGDHDEERAGGHSGAESVISGRIRLDDHGQAQIAVPTSVDKDESQDVTYTLDADVTDASERNVDQSEDVDVGQGEFSLDMTTTPYSVNPGGTVTVSLSVKNSDNKPLPNQAIEIVTAYQSWDNGHERLSDIHTSNPITDALGAIKLTPTAPRGGLFLIRAKGQDTRGNAIRAENTVWVTSGDADMATHYPDIAVLLDKPKYHIGDTARLLINTDHAGPTALVTIEGSTLYSTRTVPLLHHSTSIDVPVTTDLSPGVTVSVTCIYQKHYFATTQHLTIDDTRRQIQIHVSGEAKTYHAGDPATISLLTTDMAGNPTPAEVSVGVVDSAIYAIKAESDASILDALLPDQGDLVNTDYSCPSVYLGDVDKGAMDIKLRKNFQDTALWQPAVRTDSHGQASVQFKLPDNLTTWRVTCIGHTMDSAVGKATCEMVVNKELIVRLETPAFLIAGDSSTLTGVVNNNTSSSITAKIRLDAGALATSGDTTRSVTVPAGGSVGVDWPVTARAARDVALKLTAWTTGGGPTLTDGLQQTITVQEHQSVTDIWQAGSLVNFADRTFPLDPAILPAGSVLRIRLSSTASSALLPAWRYLSQYPYGSTDSTASTLAADAILAKNVPALLGSGTAVTTNLQAIADQKKKLTDEILHCQLRLARFQHDDGGWGWFANNKPDLWMTAYATWSLLLARDAGYQINPTVLESGLKATAALVGDWRDTTRSATTSDVALAALVLARGGKTAEATATVDTLAKLWNPPATPKDTGFHLSQADRAVTILAAHTIGGAYAAKATVWMGQLWSERRRLGALSAWSTDPHAQYMGAEQDDTDAESTAWALIAAEEMTPNDPRIDSVARWIMANRNGDHWVCPRTTSLTLMALGTYIGRSHELQPNFDATVTVNGEPTHTFHFGPQSIDEPETVFDIPATHFAFDQTAGIKPTANWPSAVLGQKSIELHVAKVGQGRLYYAADLREGIAVKPPTPPMGTLERWYDKVMRPDRLQVPFAPSGYRIKRVLLRDTSRRNFLWEDTVPTPALDFEPNDDVIVRLIIDATRPGSHLIVEEPIPAGCTISEVSGDETEEWQNWWDYTDVRDDKIVFFIGDLTRGRHEIDYHLRAASPGRYDIMPTSITGTFDPTLHALGMAGRVRVGS